MSQSALLPYKISGDSQMLPSKLFSNARALGAALGCWLVVMPDTAAADSQIVAASNGGSGRFLTTLTLVDTGGSAVAANSVTPMFGHPFRKGDIPSGCSGAAPDFRLNDGTTPVPFSESLRPTCWSDGSLKFASFMLRVPNTGAGNAIPADGTATIRIYSGGTTPAASGRALSDFTAGGLDLNVRVSGADSTLSGTWVSDLGQGIAAANSDNYQFMDGQAGAVWRIRASFRQSAANHGQLEDYWYVTATNDGSNALGGIRFLTRIAQPWYDVDSPAKNYRVFATMQMLDGASLVTDYLNGHFGSRTFSYPGSGFTFTAENNRFQPHWLVYLTTTGTLPTGLFTGTPYFIQATTANTFTLATCAACSTAITPSGAGSGTFTVTNYPDVSIFGSIFTADTHGRMEYIQGGGSVAADATIQVKFNNAYWRSTRMLPPYDLGSGITPPSTGNNLAGQPITYFPMTINEVAGFIRDVPQGGQSLEMALLPPWAARHFYNQSLTDEYDTRIEALSSAQQPMMLKSHATGTLPCVINSGSTYSPMPNCIANFQFGGDAAHTHGFTYVDTVIPNMAFNGSVIDYSHWSANAAYALLATGEPEYMDLVTELANSVIWERDYCATCAATVTGGRQWMGAKRSSTINGTLYKSFTAWAGNLLRTDAWGMRDLSFAAAILPTIHYEGGSGEAQYFKDMAHGNFLAFNAYWPLLDAGTQAMGFWNETSGDANVNTTAFFAAAVGYSAQMNEDSAATTFYNYLAKWPKQFHDNNSMWNFSYYAANARLTVANPVDNRFNNYISDFAHFCVVTPAPTVTWASGGHFTISTTVGGYTFANGDKYIWEKNDSPVTPAGFSFDTPYYAVNQSGSTFDLSVTLGGSPITLTDTNASPQRTCMLAGNAPATGNIQRQGASSYQYLFGNAMNLGAANGFDVDSATLIDMNSRWQSYGGYVNSANSMPTWSFSPTTY